MAFGWTVYWCVLVAGVRCLPFPSTNLTLDSASSGESVFFPASSRANSAAPTPEVPIRDGILFLGEDKSGGDSGKAGDPGKTGGVRLAPGTKLYTGKPSCASDRDTYCEVPEIYPKSFIETSVRKREQFVKDFIQHSDNSLSILDPVKPPRRKTEEGENPVPTRIGGGLEDGDIEFDEETPVCDARESIIYPRMAKNKAKQWLYVVNHDDYIQGIRIERCVSAGSECSISQGVPFGFETVCRQKYIYRKLIALDPNGETTADSFQMASCCVCYRRSTFLGKRIGGTSRRRSNRTPGETEENPAGQDISNSKESSHQSNQLDKASIKSGASEDSSASSVVQQPNNKTVLVFIS